MCSYNALLCSTYGKTVLVSGKRRFIMSEIIITAYHTSKLIETQLGWKRSLQYQSKFFNIPEAFLKFFSQWPGSFELKFYTPFVCSYLC